MASLAEIRACHASVRDAVLAAATSGKLLLVGSGRMPQTIVSGVRAVGGEVAALIEYDARFWGREVMGLPVLPPATCPTVTVVCVPLAFLLDVSCRPIL